MKEFEGKVALVTGGGSGIGRATAVAFAREGAHVVIGNRNVERGEETVSMIRETGGNASFQRTDVMVAADVEALIEHAMKTCKTCGLLDVAFNNAGIEGEVKPTVIDDTEFAAQGIRINAVNPAVIDTEMVDRLADGMNVKKDDLSTFHPIGRLGRIEEVAEAVLWLCSERASFVTGHSMMVDGGFTAR